MVVFTELNALLAAHGFGTASAVKHVAESLREAGLIQDGRRTPMTAQDAVALMLGMSTRGAGREKVFNVEALLAMQSLDDPDGPAFGAFLAQRIQQPSEPWHVDSVAIYPDAPCAIFSKGMPDSVNTLTWGRDQSLRQSKGVVWSVRIGSVTLRDIGAALK